MDHSIENVLAGDPKSAPRNTSQPAVKVPTKMPSEGFCFAIDRGGTFTDIFARCPNGEIHLMKLLSEDPQSYSDAPREGIRRILESEGSRHPLHRNDPIDASNISWIRMGTTVATNALLERKGEPFCLAITKGFQDLLRIGNQSRPSIFDLKIETPDVLYDHVIEVDERVVLKRADCQIPKSDQIIIDKSQSGEEVEIWTPLNEEALRMDLVAVRRKGIKNLVVALLHSYTYRKHEEIVQKIASQVGFEYITLSSSVMPMIKIVPRGLTASADGYLTPHIHKYINGFASGFRNGIDGMNVLFMQSDGGLTPVTDFTGSRAILSGPAGGVVGYAETTRDELGRDIPIIGFDMGGTSTDVSRFEKSFEHTYETTTAGIAIQAPQLDISTVAAGGGSMLFFKAGMFVVGPQSAGAHPGPACYRKGGPLTVTDANLCLNRILPKYFPKIFGTSKNLPLDTDAAQDQFKALTREVNEFITTSKESHQKEKSLEEIALGFIRVANEAMCRPIRAMTQGKGYDTSQHILSCFGGAGGQHACAIARDLGIKRVFIHRYAGILSAFGMALANVVHDEYSPTSLAYEDSSFDFIHQEFKKLEECGRSKLKEQNFTDKEITFEYYLNMRYSGTDFPLMVLSKPVIEGPQYCHTGLFGEAFLERYEREFGFLLQDRPILVDDVRVRAIGKSSLRLDEKTEVASGPPVQVSEEQVYFEGGYLTTAVYSLDQLKSGHRLEGPAVIIDSNSTILVEPECSALVTEKGNILIDVETDTQPLSTTMLDPIQLSIFSHRFMSIAEQMGRILQRTSISTNIKERLDFSCALFGPDGGLVSNAPHIPVHLGSMQEAVQYQLNNCPGGIRPGDVILTNHPQAGGSHLPDLTVITPVFHESSSEKAIFFVASRGHHADIGGLTPGSMPPHSKCLSEEGASFRSFKIVRNGVFQEGELRDHLNSPQDVHQCSGTRRMQDNISDLKAQIAANQKGISLVGGLVRSYGLNVVQAYMRYIQNNAEIAVRNFLKLFASSHSDPLVAMDCMDDGTEIHLQVTIDPHEGSAHFDFSGTGMEVYGNTNAPPSITMSAIIYCLRCMVNEDIPLNQGCLNPIAITIPERSLLSPSPDAAVVGGNVLTSQRCVDVILKAFGVCAASQGCMNNITFGDNSISYYETVAGGSGAGPSWDGHSAIHTHMTNTRITDPEILEKRYPVILRKFQIHKGTGGRGEFKGGDGVVREMLFRRPLVLSVLTERRVFLPYGLYGGENGKRGRNCIIFARDGRTVNLGGKNSMALSAGDVFRLETPGGGGYGASSLSTLRSTDTTPTPLKHPPGADERPFPSFISRGSINDYKLLQQSS